jgi:hypothetical protein
MHIQGFMPVPRSILAKRKKKREIQDELLITGVGSSGMSKTFLQKYTPTTLGAQPAARAPMRRPQRQALLDSDRQRREATDRAMEGRVNLANERANLMSVRNVKLFEDFLYEQQGKSIPSGLMRDKFGAPGRGGRYSQKQIRMSGSGLSPAQRKEEYVDFIAGSDLYTKYQDYSGLASEGSSSVRREVPKVRTRHAPPRQAPEVPSVVDRLMMGISREEREKDYTDEEKRLAAYGRAFLRGEE